MGRKRHLRRENASKEGRGILGGESYSWMEEAFKEGYFGGTNEAFQEENLARMQGSLGGYSARCKAFWEGNFVRVQGILGKKFG